MEEGEHPFVASSPVRFFVTTTRPSANATNVPTDAVLEVDLSDFPYPDRATKIWRLRTGGSLVTGAATLDLVDRRIRVRPARGLASHFEYTLELTDALRSFDGVPLEPVTIRFSTGNDPAGPTPPSALKRLRADVLSGLVRAGCATENCHAGSRAARGLDLENPAGILAAVARHAQGDPVQSLITPGAHATSFLLWKALGLPRTFGHRSPILERDAARSVADWIDQGAADN